MDAKIKNLNTTFLRGIVTSQKLTKSFSHTQTITLSTKDHFYTNDIRSSLNKKNQTKPKSLRFTIYFMN